MTSDVDRSRGFYARLLGWDAEAPNAEFGGYVNFTFQGARVAGCMESQPDTPGPDVWSVYLRSADAQQTVERAVANGGAVYVEPMAVGDLGVMAVIADVGGAAIGIWQPGEHPGFGIAYETGTPSWFELFTRDHEKSAAFYRDVFGWSTRVTGDSPEFRYTVLAEGETMYAGIMDASSFLPDGVPAHWSVYFGVDSTDDALARTTEMGGAVVQPAEDTPYGRLAVATDPTGAAFKLVGPNQTAIV
jgi:predicted enzyme related to lactoylglutathione lyase